MEPPAVTSCSVNNSNSLGLSMLGMGQQQQQQHQHSTNTNKRSDNMPVVDFLHIEPQLNFNAGNANTNRSHFEELPENFLETISPQQSGGMNSNINNQQQSSNSMGMSLHQHQTHHQHLTHNDISRSHGVAGASPQLASLTTMGTMSMAGGVDGGGGYATLISMPAPSHYVNSLNGSLKMETIGSMEQHLSNHASQLHHPSSASLLDKARYGSSSSFSSGPAGLLSPLQLLQDGGGNRLANDQNSLGLLGVHHTQHRSNGRTSDMLSGIRRPVSYISGIKEEIGSDMVSFGQNQQDVYESAFGSMQQQGQPTAQELERMANAETPPALSNVEIASSILASLAGESSFQPSSPAHQQISPTQNQMSNSHQQQQHFIVHHMPQQQQPQMVNAQQQQQQPAPTAPRQARNTNNRTTGNKSASKADNTTMDAGKDSLMDFVGQGTSNHPTINNNNNNTQRFGPMGPGAGIPRAVYSTSDVTDPLNAEIDDEIYIDTKDLCKRVAYELKQHSIPQAIFAERILCRSQGTLSDLLRNPKPWNRLKSGRETFRRMFNWLQQPLHIRLSILDMYKDIPGPMGSGSIAPPTPAQNSRQHTRQRATSGDENGHPHPKRPRLVFTDIQKRTLQAIFKETQRPSREMQQTIAEHLRLDMSTVSNFFMNARRRSRNGSTTGDEPAPYQQIRSITPPPDSPPTSQPQNSSNSKPNGTPAASNRNRTNFKSASTASNDNNAISQHQMAHHIEETVAEVVGRSAAYCQQQQQQQQQLQNRQQLGPLSPLSGLGEETARAGHPPSSMWDDDLEEEEEDFNDEEEEQEEQTHSPKSMSLMLNAFQRAITSTAGSTSSTSSTTRNIPLSHNKIIKVKVEHESSQPCPSATDNHQEKAASDEYLGRNRPETFSQEEEEQLAEEEEEPLAEEEGRPDQSTIQEVEDNANAPTMPGTPTGGQDATDALSPVQPLEKPSKNGSPLDSATLPKGEIAANLHS